MRDFVRLCEIVLPYRRTSQFAVLTLDVNASAACTDGRCFFNHSTLSYQLSAFLLILFVANLFHPVYDFYIERFLNRDVRHRGRRRSAAPMLFRRRKSDDIPWHDT